MMLAVPVRLFEHFARLLQVLGQVVLAFMALTITYDATMRYIFAAPTSWSLEINAFLVGIVGCVFCAIITWRGGLMAYDAWAYGERVSSGFGTPMWLPYGMLPIGFGALGLQFLINTLQGPPPRSDVIHHV